MINNLKGHMINNNIQIFRESVLQGYHEYKDYWPEGSNFAPASARERRYFRIDIFAPEFAPQVSTTTGANFYPKVRFYKKWR